MNYDDILEELGQFSRWHFVATFPLFLTMATAALGILSFSFTGLEPNEFRCLIPQCNETLENATVNEFGIDIFWKEGDDVDYCYTRPLIDSQKTSQHCTNNSFNYSDSLQKDDYQFCKPDDNLHVVYGAFGMDSNAVTEFDLVCDDKYKVFLTATLTMCALLIGSYVFGYISDKFGRKVALIISQAIVFVGLILGAFMPEYISFTTARFIAGFGSVGCMLIPFGLGIELVGNKYKTFFGLFYKIPFAIGEVIVGLLAIGIRDYVTFQWVLAIPVLIVAILSVWTVPESPRWLIKKNECMKALKIVNNASKFNKVEISAHLLDTPKEHSSNGFQQSIRLEIGTIDLFRHSGSRKVTFIMMIDWIAINLAFYGIAYFSTALSSNVYLNFILNGLVEIPMIIFCILTMDHIGRKPLITFNLFLCGICCLPAGYTEAPLKTALVLIGKMGSSGAFAIAYVYCAEMYPTIVRGTALGLSSLAGRIGGIIAPLVALYLPALTFDALPLIIFGVTNLVAGVLTFWLPETLGSPLVESLDEIYILYKNSKPIYKWWSNEKVNNNIEEIISMRNEASKSTNR